MNQDNELDDLAHDVQSPVSPIASTSLQPQTTPSNVDKKPVIRGARACMVCRAAKMRCIGGDDQASGTRPCNRCRKSGVECRFEKHRRGRKPGSKLSDSAKLARQSKQQNSTTGSSQGFQQTKMEEDESDDDDDALGVPSLPQPSRPWQASSRSEYMDVDNAGASSSRHLPPPPPPQHHYHRQPLPTPDDDRNSDENLSNLHPAAILAKEKTRQSFLATVLGPGGPSGSGARTAPSREASEPESLKRLPPCFETKREKLPDPIELGLLTEAECSELLDRMLMTLNPFVSLFDPKLHTVPYIRSRSSFLFTVLMMAGCKFFRQELYKPLQKMAYVFATRAFDEQWKGVEVVQAFCCLVYWKEPEDSRTWLYIGYACRMAVELGLNTFTSRPPPTETDAEKRERRNRERTYLVLFVHDRSLSMQTGRAWMLQEDELVRSSQDWHRKGCELRTEDVTVAAFVQLRRLSADTTNVFHLRRNSDNSDVNYEVLLNGCNTKLTAWAEEWEHEMRRAGGNDFHINLLNFFRLHVRLFLNSLGLTRQNSANPSDFSLQALSLCLSSANDTLRIVNTFREMEVLRYAQDVLTVMSAYAAIFLLRLARRSERSNPNSQVVPSEIRQLIQQTAGAFYDEAFKGGVPSASSSAAAHARFLHNLVQTDQDDEIRRQRSQSTQAQQQPQQDLTRTPSVQTVESHQDTNGYSTDQSSMTLHSPVTTRPHVQSPPYPTPTPTSGRPDNLTISTSVSRQSMVGPQNYTNDSTAMYQSVQHYPQQQPTPTTSVTETRTAYSTTNGHLVNGRQQDHSQYHQQQQQQSGPQSPHVYQQQRQQPLSQQVAQPIMRYTAEPTAPPLPLDPHSQLMLQQAPEVDPEYTRQMYEQLGMQSAHLHNGIPYIAPSDHPHLPTVPDSMYSQF